MKLRRFNEQGVRAFRERLAIMRQNPEAEVPNELIEHSQLTEVVSPEIQVAVEYFETKGEAAQYINAILKSLRAESVATDAGLWTWLSLLFFDSVCPAGDGKRNVRNDYHYIFEPRNMRHFYRHLLFISWNVYKLSGRYSRLFLRSRVSVLDHITTDAMKRLFMTRIPCMFEVLDRLYWDEPRKRPRKGITGSRPTPGNLSHRLPLRISQLEKTYDLMSLTADQLIDLLGDEFAFARQKTANLFEDGT